jgi:hypothetical protein
LQLARLQRNVNAMRDWLKKGEEWLSDIDALARQIVETLRLLRDFVRGVNKVWGEKTNASVLHREDSANKAENAKRRDGEAQDGTGSETGIGSQSAETGGASNPVA